MLNVRKRNQSYYCPSVKMSSQQGPRIWRALYRWVFSFELCKCFCERFLVTSFATDAYSKHPLYPFMQCCLLKSQEGFQSILQTSVMTFLCQKWLKGDLQLVLTWRESVHSANFRDDFFVPKMAKRGPTTCFNLKRNCMYILTHTHYDA